MAHSKIYRKIRYRLLFPGLFVSESATLEISGRFSYGSGTSVSEGARIFVGPDSVLRIGENVLIGRQCEIAHGSIVEIGDLSSIQDRCMIHGDVSIGRYCSLSLNVFVSASTHCFDLYPEMFIKDQDLIWINRPDLLKDYRRPVRIEDDCWLGINSVILPGTTIGKGAIIGANAVVTKDVPPYVVAVGAPARVVKRRLQFEPPRAVSYSSEKDSPYFYSGFAMSAKELEVGRGEGGVCAGRRFRLAMDTTGGKSLLVQIRALVGVRCVVNFQGQSMEIGREMGILRFALNDDPNEQLDFTVSTDAVEYWVVCVASAQVN